MKLLNLDYIPLVICSGVVLFILGIAAHDINQHFKQRTLSKFVEEIEWNVALSTVRADRVRYRALEKVLK